MDLASASLQQRGRRPAGGRFRIDSEDLWLDLPEVFDQALSRLLSRLQARD